MSKSKVVSYSQYSMWSTCPLQWERTYIDKALPAEESIVFVFGHAMHRTVQEWLEIAFNKSKIMARTLDLSEVLKGHLIREFERSITEEDGQKIYVCDKQMLMEYYKDGCDILDYLQSNLDRLFPTIEFNLEGIEILVKREVLPGVNFRGYLDIVLRHKLTGSIKIIDLKTSTKGWNKWKKNDKVKTNQLLLYKKFYAKQFDVSEDAITVEFIILKRKLYENADYPQHRTQVIRPACKKPSMNAAMKDFKRFMSECFTVKGEHISGQKATPSEHACKYCPFNQTEHCTEGILA